MADFNLIRLTFATSDIIFNLWKFGKKKREEYHFIK